MANPIISRAEITTGVVPMSVSGVVKKTAFLLALSATTGFALFFYALMTNLSGGMLSVMSLVSVLLAMGLGLGMAFKPHLAKTLSVPYALIEGVFLGAITAIVYRHFPQVPLLALSATFVSAAVMLTLYTTGIVKVTEKFRSIIISATIAIAIVYVIQMIMSWIFGSSIPYLFDGGLIAIGFSVFVTLIACFNLLLDFDNIEKGVQFGVDKDFEWLYGVGVLATLVWMYFEFLRLISYFQD